MSSSAIKPNERAIRLLQEKLHIPITGVLDADTEHAIREFQLHHEIPVTGIADEATNALLFSDVETLMQFQEDE